MDILADAGRQVVEVDLLGHGQSPRPVDPEAYDEVEELVLDALPTDRPVDAVGFSAGAMVLVRLRGGTCRALRPAGPSRASVTTRSGGVVRPSIVGRAAW